MLSRESAQQVLRNSGTRITPQRLMVIDVLVDNHTHPTVDEIYHQVQICYPTISLATVYHTLALLAENGLIVSLHGGKDGLRYDPEVAPHAHAYCKFCGKVQDMPYPEMQAWHDVQLSGFQPGNIEVSMFGHCAECRSDK